MVWIGIKGVAFARQWPLIHKEIGGAQTPLFFMPHSVYTDSAEHLSEVATLGKRIRSPHPLTCI